MAAALSEKQFNQLFQLRWASKQLTRSATKCEKEEQKKRKQLTASIAKGNLDIARIYAADCIRLKNEALSYLRLSSRLDGLDGASIYIFLFLCLRLVRSRLEMAYTTKATAVQLEGVVKQMSKLVQTSDLEKMTAVFDQFEQQNENLEVQQEVMDSSMARSTSSLVPQWQVESLICQVADEHSLELQTLLPTIDRDKIEREKAAAQQASSSTTKTAVLQPSSN
ncbi:Charged multivesicular body protein 1b [Balamuthia mandrillaris]